MPDRHPPTGFEDLMLEAVADARLTLATGDVPVAAIVIAADGTVIGRGRNERELTSDPTAHAEIVAIRQATAAAAEWRLSDATLVVTLEPCVMCAGRDPGGANPARGVRGLGRQGGCIRQRLRPVA